MLIQPQYLSLATLLHRRLFQIPDYQRSYSWGVQQREDLFNDIKKTHENGKEEHHFMAAIVCLRSKKQMLDSDEYHIMDIVDGQQRITTLIILLNAVKLALDRKNNTQLKLAEELSALLVKADGNELLLLQTNHDSSHYFADYLRRDKISPPAGANTFSDRAILEAIENCTNFVVKWTEDDKDLISLASLLKNRLYFLLHETNDEKTVYSVFEVLNSRGLAVSAIDRLKSILMGTAYELEKINNAQLIRDLHTTWRDIYSTIGLRQGFSTEALRFAATLKAKSVPSRPLGETKAVDAIRLEAENAKKIREAANWLLEVAKACDAVFANQRLNAVTRISQARLLAAAINLRQDFKESDRKALLVSWEKVTFRIYGMLAHDARTQVGNYARLAWQIINEKLSVKNIHSAIRSIGRDFPIDRAVKSLRARNCYEAWENELRYLLYRYEEHLSKQQKLNYTNENWEKIWLVSASQSIEHIWAKSEAPSRHKHRLGNLVLLPPKLNSKLQASQPKDKSVSYRKTGLLIALEVADSIDKNGWSIKEIEKREDAILNWATIEWAD